MPTPQHDPAPGRPNLDYLRHVAKDMLRDARAGTPDAISRLGELADPKLADAQRVLANEHGHRTWAELRNSIEGANAARQVRRASRSDKHARESTLTAAGFMASAKANGWQPSRLPRIVVLVFQSSFASTLEQDPGFEEEPSLAPGNGRVFISIDREPAIAVSCLSPGATTMVNQLENQVALGGAHTFVAYNLAGGIGPDINPGDISVVGAAVRDDGISDHYLPPADTIDADTDLTTQLQTSLVAQFPTCRTRTTWTNPAVYRQTAEELQHYADSGVSLVESETASLLAVAAAVGVSATAVLVPTTIWNDGQTRAASDPSTIAEVHRNGFQSLLDSLAPKRPSDEP